MSGVMHQSNWGQLIIIANLYASRDLIRVFMHFDTKYWGSKQAAWPDKADRTPMPITQAAARAMAMPFAVYPAPISLGRPEKTGAGGGKPL
jgi:hypothetical protein